MKRTGFNTFLILPEMKINDHVFQALKRKAEESFFILFWLNKKEF